MKLWPYHRYEFKNVEKMRIEDFEMKKIEEK
jgi:hypothetical protein